MLEAAVAAGVAAAGGEALLGGILPTPGAPLLIARHGFDLGVVISASHNPYRDNGIKFFGGDGYKLSDATEAEIEAALEQPPADPRAPGPRAHASTARSRTTCARCTSASRDLDLQRPPDPARLRQRRDLPRRAGDLPPPRRRHRRARRTSPTAATSTTAAAPPTSTASRPAMQAGDDDAGFAFDGDGDRMLAVDRNGAVVDGDELIALAALHLREAGRLPGNGVAVTVMTNYGFHTAMARARRRGRDHRRSATATCSRRCASASWALGGEQSGHIIDRNFVPSGDGIAAALLTLEALGGGDLADRHAMEKLPQTLVNVRVRDRGALEQAAEVHEAVERESAALEGRGRVLLRPSGTEPLVRVMVEAPTADEADAVCARLVALVESELS